MLQSHGLQPGGQLLIGLHQQLDQVLDQVPVLLIEEAGGKTQVTHTTSSTNTVDILLYISWQVKVDDMLDIGDIQTSGSNSSGNYDGSLASLESATKSIDVR